MRMAEIAMVEKDETSWGCGGRCKPPVDFFSYFDALREHLRHLEAVYYHFSCGFIGLNCFMGGHDSQKGGQKHTMWAEMGEIGPWPHWLKKIANWCKERDPRKVAMIARSTEQKLYPHQNIVMIAHSA